MDSTGELLKNNLDNIKEGNMNLFGERQKKLSMKDRIGFIPISIWQPDWNVVNTLKPIVGDDGSTRELIGDKMQLPGSKYSVSIFNPHLAQMILSAYCPTKAKIYDAFGGGGTRGFIATAMGHDYLGVEIRADEVERIQRQMDTLGLHFTMVAEDSTKFAIQPEVFDFSYSCPPYYDLEVYSELEGDMSNADTYEDFLKMLAQSLVISYLGLKPGALCVWVVGNFRDKKGCLVHFNGDLARLGKEVGFDLWDELIFWGASGAAHQRAGQFEANRKSVRVHEYIVIFKKPERSKSSTLFT